MWRAIKPRLDEKLLAPAEGDTAGGGPTDSPNEDVEMTVVKHEMTDSNG